RFSAGRVSSCCLVSLLIGLGFKVMLPLLSKTMFRSAWLKALAIVLAFAALLPTSREAEAETRLRNICRVKGQEENVLQGLGLVGGLNGTGEPGDALTMRSMARAMELLGSPVGANGTLDEAAVEELKKIKNA